ncbi:MAG: S41 family peptidase [Anaerolineae bacterium]|nr:S41 family peptidase [Anaerolineae bacterium]MCI0607617.1 S41 family peptidase [Anaerolineae bacterium]
MKTILGLFVGIILLAGAFAGGVLVGHLVPASNQLPFFSDLIPSVPSVTPEEQAATPDELQTLFVPFWEAWNIVHEQYVDQPVDDVALMRGAIRGMMDALGDKQTFYMDPITYETETSSLQGEYEGIGAYVDTDGEYLTIISPIAGSPAEMAGLRPGDKVIAIDGEDMTGVAPEQARLKVLGPAGTTIILKIQREGEPEPLEFTITRARISIKSAEGKMLEDGIAYVDINTFGDNTTSELRSTLDTLLKENPRGIIIDLRNNPGGYLHTSVEVSSEFIAEGVVLYEQYGDGRRDVYNANGNGQATDLPIVVLVNEGSASASEILAGALQDYGRATLVGVQSYGKGSVQNWVPLSNDQGAARVTIAKWLTPKERAIDGIGLTPDVYVDCSECILVETENDIQVQAAIETLLAVLNGSPAPTSMPTRIPTPVQ